MKILFFTVDNEIRASCRTRVYAYLPYLKKEGIECKVIAWYGKKKYSLFTPSPKLNPFLKKTLKSFDFACSEIRSYLSTTWDIFLGFLHIKDYDLVFIQKLNLKRLYWILKLAKVKFIYDFDDPIYVDHSKSIKKNKEKDKTTIEMIKLSQHVITVSSFNVAWINKYCSNVSVIISPVDTQRYHPKQSIKNNEKITIGWIGSHDNTVYLFSLKNVLEKLLNKYPNLEIKLVGSRGFDLCHPRLIKMDWSLDRDFFDLQSFDIGIMPLTDDEWARGKGGYKILQYMAVGIPAVASPVGINRDLIKEGRNGFLAKDEKEWEEKLSLLIENKRLRESMGKAALDLVLPHSVQAVFPKFKNVLEMVAGQ